MIKAQLTDRERLVNYLSKDIDNCVYLYIDIKTYDICSENISVWYQEENGTIISVAMKYYDSFQVYSRNQQIDVNELTELLNTYNVSMISGPRFLIEKLERTCKGYEATYGEVFECYPTEKPQRSEIVECAKIENAHEIAEFVCSDKEFAKNYSVEVFEKQLTDRIRLNLGRSYYIRVDGRIIAHTGAYAEADDVAVISGAVVDKKYRNDDYYVILGDYLCYTLGREGKKLYSFATNRRVIYFLSINCRNCGHYGKLNRICNL